MNRIPIPIPRAVQAKTDPITADWANKIRDCIVRLNAKLDLSKHGYFPPEPTTTCPFGEIINIPDSDPPAKGIAGGIVICGDQTWNMDPQELNLETDGTWLVSLDVEVVVNMDDDAELLLPGVKTGTKPTAWTKTDWTTGTDYPPGTNPSVPTGEGTIILPLGSLTITDGKPYFSQTGCGNFEIKHCSGTLSYSRSS